MSRYYDLEQGGGRSDRRRVNPRRGFSKAGVLQGGGSPRRGFSKAGVLQGGGSPRGGFSKEGVLQGGGSPRRGFSKARGVTRYATGQCAGCNGW